MEIEELADSAIKDGLKRGHALIKCKNVVQAEALLARLEARIPEPSDRRWGEMPPSGQHRHLVATIIRNKEVNVFSVSYYREGEDASEPTRVQLSTGGRRWRSDVVAGPPKKPKKPRKKKPRYMNKK